MAGRAGGRRATGTSPLSIHLVERRLPCFDRALSDILATRIGVFNRKFRMPLTIRLFD